MGYGDALMASAQARVLNEALGVKVALGDGQRVVWKRPDIEIFDGNPRLATQDDVNRGEPVRWLENWSGHRPYIDRERMVAEFEKLFPNQPFTMKRRIAALPWRYTDWKVADVGPGEIYLNAAERRNAKDVVPHGKFAVVEPVTKQGASPNKEWLFEGYAEVVQRMGLSFVQFNPVVPLPGAIPVRTNTFRQAVAVLAHATFYLGCEGGLHHAAAAVGVPSIVYFGGMLPPHNTAYENTTPIYREGDPCGQRVACSHCAEIANSITVSEVLEKIEGVLHG